MRGRAAAPPEMTPQAVAIEVSNALRAAGFSGSSAELQEARYRLAAWALEVPGVLSFKRLDPCSLEQVWRFAQDAEAVKKWVEDDALLLYREKATCLLRPFVMRLFGTAHIPYLEEIPTYNELHNTIADALKREREAT